MMTKKQFIELADRMRGSLQPDEESSMVYVGDVVDSLVPFCKSQNPRFDEQRWRDYLASRCGPNGGRR